MTPGLFSSNLKSLKDLKVPQESISRHELRPAHTGPTLPLPLKADEFCCMSVETVHMTWFEVYFLWL